MSPLPSCRRAAITPSRRGISPGWAPLLAAFAADLQPDGSKSPRKSAPFCQGRRDRAANATLQSPEFSYKIHDPLNIGDFSRNNSGIYQRENSGGTANYQNHF